jgi:hypothetical protein
MRGAALGGSKGEYAIGHQQAVNRQECPVRPRERSEHLRARPPQPDSKNDSPDRPDHEEGSEDARRHESNRQQEDADRDVADGYDAKYE